MLSLAKLWTNDKQQHSNFLKCLNVYLFIYLSNSAWRFTKHAANGAHLLGHLFLFPSLSFAPFLAFQAIDFIEWQSKWAV